MNPLDIVNVTVQGIVDGPLVIFETVNGLKIPFPHSDPDVRRFIDAAQRDIDAAFRRFTIEVRLVDNQLPEEA